MVKPQVMLVPGRLTPDVVAQKCRELIEYADKLGGVDAPTVRKIEEVRQAAREGTLTRVQAHLLTTVEKAIKNSMRWKFHRMREMIGDEARVPVVNGVGVLVNGVEWKNPVTFRREFEFRCPRAVVGKSRVTLEECESYKCSCIGMIQARLIVARIEAKIDEEQA